MSSSILLEKSYAFALRIVRLSEYLTREKKEFVSSRKVHIKGVHASSMLSDCEQLQKMLIASRKTSRNEG